MTILFKPQTYDAAIAHIADQDGNIFQVLNESGDDWDEAATKAQEATFYNQTNGK